MIKLKRFFALSAFVVTSYLIFLGTKSVTQGFTVTAIDQNIPLTDAPSAASLEVSQRLSQPFYYYSAGGQSYVFLGKDQQTILKFFKKNHGLSDKGVLGVQALFPSSLAPYRKKFLPTRDERFNSIFTGCKIAYDHLREETKILYLHLDPEALPLRSVTIVDPMGIHHQIPLETTSFLLQERAQPFFPRFKQQIRSGNIEEAKTSIHSLLSYLVLQSRKGIRDCDKGLRRNYGFFGNEVALIDTGSLTLDPGVSDPLELKKEVTHKTHRLERWLRHHAPELLPYYHEELETMTQGDSI
ncbi:MAG: hypothetical protein JSR58_07960 [Verrucomicrobia bacterium]|nr:hypothetical protein [Verrucomicrobiota bacterium]